MRIQLNLSISEHEILDAVQVLKEEELIALIVRIDLERADASFTENLIKALAKSFAKDGYPDHYAELVSEISEYWK